MSNTDLNLEVSKLNEWIPQILGEVPDIEYALDYVEINNFAIEVKNAIRGIKFGVLASGRYNARKYLLVLARGVCTNPIVVSFNTTVYGYYLLS